MALRVIRKAARRCAAVMLKGSPPEPCDEVKKLMKTYRMAPEHLLHMYDVFHYLKQLEDKEAVFVSALEVEVESLKRLVVDRRKWVLRILVQLLHLGECDENVMWDDFLWILLRFCTLNRCELSQVLFHIIQNELGTPQRHYLTAADLQKYYLFYKDCPVRSFSTQGFDFEKMPLARYYISDFAEVTERFSQLVNPIIHLQRVIQGHLPGIEFWDNVDRADSFSRKIAHDFFVMDTGRVHLRGEPPFRESCDMLMPDALGAMAVNEEQWVMRTSTARGGTGLRQVSVWGEQPPPECIDKIRRQLDREAEAERVAAEERKMAEIAAEAKAQRERARRAQMLVQAEAGDLDDTWREEQEAPVKEAWPETPGPEAAYETSPVTTLVGRRGPSEEQRRLGVPELVGGAPPPPPPLPEEEKVGPKIDARALSLLAATMDESNMSPIDLLPPKWMTGATCAPAPQLPNWGSPAPNRLGRPTGPHGDRMTLLAAR